MPAAEDPLTSDTAGVKYARARIAEAVLDVRVDELDSAALARMGAYVDAAYPTREDSVRSEAQIDWGPLGVAAKSVCNMNGYRFSSADGR